ncbi:Dynein regulatory complex subunit 3 [Kappamyces sp. JEL0680]|nr:Dynein regulatory complex subunit 3 [Kappamyces sp. JEL0680]
MSYSSIEPTVIDEDLIRKAINEQINPEIAEIAKREGIDPEEVLHLRLDYKNILKIDNLWIYENITKLQLDNNIIEKIENIHFMTNLEWLDLSFNNITTIEGLGTLTKLTDLTLFNNRISRIENMDELVNLQVFSIGNNNISQLDAFSYLIKFEHLRVLHAAGNPVQKNPNYKHYCLAHLKGLKYLDYRLIDQESSAAAREKYIDAIIALEEEEMAANTRKLEAKKQMDLDRLHSRAHILHIDSLFDRMFNDDADFKKLLPIAPTILSDMKEEFRAKFGIVVKEFKLYVLKNSQDKDDEYNMIHKCLADVKGASDKECLAKLEVFYHQKKELLKIVQNSRSSKEVDEAIKELRELTKNLSTFLMNQEMIIIEQFEEVIKEFERNYTEICNAISENGQSSFSRLRDLENEYLEKFTEAIMSMYDRFNKGDIEEIMSDKDILTNAVNASHDFRLLKLDAQEDLLVTGCTKDQERVVKEMHKAEIKRNRDRVGEIVALLDKCNADIDAAEDNSY